MATRYPENQENIVEENFLDLGEVLERKIPVIPQYDQFGHMVAVWKQGKNPGEFCYPSGVAIDETSNHIYVVEGLRCGGVTIFSDRGEFLNTFTHENMKYPYGIALHRNNMYVTDNKVHGVLHFKIETDIRIVAELVGKGSSDGKFNSPGQLAVSDNGDLFIADSHNHRIQILDESLHFQRSITHESMHFPQDVKLTTDEVYILSSKDSPCVHVFSYAGDKLRSLITCGTGLQVRFGFLVKFFCLDAEKNLIIYDVIYNSIKVFSPNGTLLHKITCIEPKGVALTKNLKLVVTSSNGLKIFSA